MSCLQETHPRTCGETHSIAPQDIEISDEFEDPEQEMECLADKQREGALFLLQLKEKNKLQQSVINNVVQGTTGLVQNSVHRLKKKVTDFLETEGLHDVATSENFQDLWREEETPFEGLETLYHQEQYMRKTFPYVVCTRGYFMTDAIILYIKSLSPGCKEYVTLAKICFNIISVFPNILMIWQIAPLFMTNLVLFLVHFFCSTSLFLLLL